MTLPTSPIAAPNTVPGPAPGARPAADAAAATADYETFLRMLTAQLTNQDPLDPMQTEELAVQLATFSSVEQQVRTNELLERIAARGLTEVAAMIGMEARAPVAARFAGAPVTVYPQFATGAETASLIVRDARGVEVARQDVSPGAAEIVWDGTGPDGDPLPEGLYSFAVESRSGERTLETMPAAAWGRVSEVTLRDGAPVLVFEDGTALAPGDLAAIRAPDGAG